MALFACAGAGLFEAIQLQVPFNGTAWWSAIVRILYPLARLDEGHPRYAALVVDTNSARIFVFGTGALLDTVDVQNPKTKHSKAGGWSQARFQRRVENVHLHHAKEVVERLDQIVSSEDIEHIVVAGDEVIVPLLKEHFPERLTQSWWTCCVWIFGRPNTRCSLPRWRRCAKDEETDEAVVEDSNRQLPCRRARRWSGPTGAGGARARAGRYAGDLREPDQIAGGDEAANRLVTLAQQTSAAVRFIENARLLADVGGVGASLRYLI